MKLQELLLQSVQHLLVILQLQLQAVPVLALKTEAIGLAVMTELPLVIIDVQRGGPSTGLPTKTEQADLLQAVVWKKW